MAGANSQLLTTAQAARALGVSAGRLAAWRRKGEVTDVVRFGRRQIRYRATDVEALRVTWLRQEQEGRVS